MVRGTGVGRFFLMPFATVCLAFTFPTTARERLGALYSVSCAPPRCPRCGFQKATLPFEPFSFVFRGPLACTHASSSASASKRK